jgi:hypothetical protein
MAILSKLKITLSLGSTNEYITRGYNTVNEDYKWISIPNQAPDFGRLMSTSRPGVEQNR